MIERGALAQEAFDLVVVAGKYGREGEFVLVQDHAQFSFYTDLVKWPAQLLEKEPRRDLLRFHKIIVR